MDIYREDTEVVATLPTTPALIERAKAYVRSRYNDSFEWSAFTECYETAEWVQFIERDGEDPMTTWKQVKAQLIFTERCRTSYRLDIEATAF